MQFSDIIYFFLNYFAIVESKVNIYATHFMPMQLMLIIKYNE